MSNLGNLFLVALGLYFLVPVAAALHSDFHYRFLSVFGQALSTNQAETAFTVITLSSAILVIVTTCITFSAAVKNLIHPVKALITPLLCMIPVGTLYMILLLLSSR